jgi:carbonic anhydrase
MQCQFPRWALSAFLSVVAVSAVAQEPASAAASSSPAIQTKASQAAMTPEKALEILKAGNRRFTSGSPVHRDLLANVHATAEGQYPFGAIVSCMDSRGPVELIFDQTIGDVFSIRVAGNVVNADVLGSLEYATKVAGAKLIVVLGHTHCGAVKGAIDNVKLGNLTELLARISPAVTAAGPGSSKDHAYVDRVAEQNVRLAMKQIREKSLTIRDLLASGAIHLVGGMYDIDTGRVQFYEAH